MSHFKQLATIACLALVSQGANAYNYTTAGCGNLNFNNGYMTFNYANNLSTAEKADISTAFSRLTAFSDSGITTVDNGDSSFSRGNGQSEIYMDATHGTAQCWASYNTSTCNVGEADIRFGDEPWVTGSNSNHWPYDNSAATGGRSIMGTAVHEGGHCIGMAHENALYNMMGEDWSHVTRNGTLTYYGPGEDLSDGLIDLHGKRSATDIYRDVGATDLRYEFADGAYSDHQFGVLRTTGGTTLPVVGSYEGQNIFEVVAGQTVSMEITFENNGEKNTENVHVGFYLSTNHIISSSDTLLGTDDGYVLTRNSPYEVTESVTIPVSTAPGDYYLGAYVDHDNLVPEQTNSNNVAYYPITVLPAPPDLTVPFTNPDDSTLLPNQPFSIISLVRNDGDGPSAATSLRYFRSTNAIISLSDSWVGADGINGLAPNGTQANNDAENAPATEGTWWYGSCVIAVANEAVTNNNCSAGAQVTVAIQPPSASTSAVTNIDTVQATVNATVNPNSGATTVYFDWGTNNQYGNTLTYGGVGAGLNDVNVTAALTGLICNTTYQVRVRAVNSAGTTLGSVMEFTTLMCPGCQ